MDDLICIENDMEMMEEFKSSMKKQLVMTDMGKMKYFLGIEVVQGTEGIH